MNKGRRNWAGLIGQSLSNAMERELVGKELQEVLEAEKSALESLLDEEVESYDSMPETFETRREESEEAQDSIQEAIDELDNAIDLIESDESDIDVDDIYTCIQNAIDSIDEVAW